jgi:hypothetical protein
MNQHDKYRIKELENQLRQLKPSRSLTSRVIFWFTSLGIVLGVIWYVCNIPWSSGLQWVVDQSQMPETVKRNHADLTQKIETLSAETKVGFSNSVAADAALRVQVADMSDAVGRMAKAVSRIGYRGGMNDTNGSFALDLAWLASKTNVSRTLPFGVNP